tara:strand:- start:3405 stop:4196 length:792 start_codon:yes stop_codon:yes gene_type:complete
MPLKDRGFTLIEVAILLVVIGLIAAGGLAIINPLLDSGRASTTLKRMALVEKALQSYIQQFGCLPCPANGALASTAAGNFGRSLDSAGLVAGNCTANSCVTGTLSYVVPWITLGLSEEQATDGWNSRIRYFVGAGTPCNAAAGLQDTNGMTRCTTTSYPAGNVTITDNDGVFAATTNAAYVIVSSGPDQSRALKYRTGTLTGDRYAQTGGGLGQEENFDDDATYSYGDFISVNGTTHFDDIVRYKSAPVMIQQCGPGACGNPS